MKKNHFEFETFEFQIELTTLESTVAQLERQKDEAEKRLEALDSQIAQLGRNVEQSMEKIKEEEKRLAELHSQSTQNEEDKAVSNCVYFLLLKTVFYFCTWPGFSFQSTFDCN